MSEVSFGQGRDRRVTFDGCESETHRDVAIKPYGMMQEALMICKVPGKARYGSFKIPQKEDLIPFFRSIPRGDRFREQWAIVVGQPFDDFVNQISGRSGDVRIIARQADPDYRRDRRVLAELARRYNQWSREQRPSSSTSGVSSSQSSLPMSPEEYYATDNSNVQSSSSQSEDGLSFSSLARLAQDNQNTINVLKNGVGCDRVRGSVHQVTIHFSDGEAQHIVPTAQTTLHPDRGESEAFDLTFLSPRCFLEGEKGCPEFFFPLEQRRLYRTLTRQRPQRQWKSYRTNRSYGIARIVKNSNPYDCEKVRSAARGRDGDFYPTSRSLSRSHTSGHGN